MFTTDSIQLAALFLLKKKVELTPGTYIAMGVIALFVVALMIWALKGIPISCAFCNNHKITPFKKLNLSQQKILLDYFTHYENRIPDTAGIFVCLDCKVVYDDFSGEKRSREADIGLNGNTTLCKVCNHPITHCDLDNEEIRCTRCSTLYKWKNSLNPDSRF